MRSFSEMVNCFCFCDDDDDKVIFNDNDFVNVNDNFVFIKKAGIYQHTMFKFMFLNGIELQVMHNAIFAFKNGKMVSISNVNFEVPFLLTGRIPI